MSTVRRNRICYDNRPYLTHFYLFACISAQITSVGWKCSRLLVGLLGLYVWSDPLSACCSWAFSQFPDNQVKPWQHYCALHVRVSWMIEIRFLYPSALFFNLHPSQLLLMEFTISFNFSHPVLVSHVLQLHSPNSANISVHSIFARQSLLQSSCAAVSLWMYKV